MKKTTQKFAHVALVTVTYTAGISAASGILFAAFTAFNLILN